MDSYIDITKRILKYGKDKPSRAGETIALPNVFWEHYMEDGFPLLTTRQMPMKSIAVELEGFIKGITSKGWYQARGCRFWDNWANPKVVDLMVKDINNPIIDCGPGWRESQRPWLSKICDDLGPLGYSFQMRRFGEAWDEDDGGLLQGVDQLADVVRKLKDSKNDRRMIVSYWNPPQIDKMALPPCTVAWGATVIGGELHLSWYQRSVDFCRGGSNDIASMGLLHTLLGYESNLPLGKLSALFVDCHLYQQDIEPMKILCSRKSRQLPTISIPKQTSIFDWDHTNLIVHNYDPWPKLELGAIAV